MVLGQNAPALYFASLNELDRNKNDLETQREIVQHSIFRYSTIESTTPTSMGEKRPQAKIQNMFQYLSKQNESEVLKEWL